MEQATVRLSFALGQIRLVYNGQQQQLRCEKAPYASLSVCLSVCMSVHSSACPFPPEGACRLINLGKRGNRLVAGPQINLQMSLPLCQTPRRTLPASLSLCLSPYPSATISPCWPHTQLGLWQFKNHIKLVSKKSPQRNHQQIISN